MLIDEEGKARVDVPDKAEMTNPTQARTENVNNQSVSRSKTMPSSTDYTDKTKKPSVREFLRERTANNNQKREETKIEREQPKPKQTRQKTHQHKQPQRGGKKSKITKER
jgi:hypothetical protein